MQMLTPAHPRRARPTQPTGRKGNVDTQASRGFALTRTRMHAVMNRTTETSTVTATRTQVVTSLVFLSPVGPLPTLPNAAATPAFASSAPMPASALYGQSVFGYAVAATAIGAAMVTMGIGRLLMLLRR